MEGARDMRKARAGCGAEPRDVDIDNVYRYDAGMIRSFRDKESQRVFERQPVKRFGPGLHRIALRKLLVLDAVERLDELRVPPGNRLERLTGARAGQHSIRINDQWRICFVWVERGASDVEIVDYH